MISWLTINLEWRPQGGLKEIFLIIVTLIEECVATVLKEISPPLMTIGLSLFPFSLSYLSITVVCVCNSPKVQFYVCFTINENTVSIITVTCVLLNWPVTAEKPIVHFSCGRGEAEQDGSMQVAVLVRLTSNMS